MADQRALLIAGRRVPFIRRVPERNRFMGGDRLLHLHVLAVFGAEFNRFQPDIWKRADIDDLDVFVLNEVFKGGNERTAIAVGKCLAGGRKDVGTCDDLPTDHPPE